MAYQFAVFLLFSAAGAAAAAGECLNEALCSDDDGQSSVALLQRSAGKKALQGELARAATSKASAAQPTTLNFGTASCPCVALDKVQGVLNLTYNDKIISYAAETGGHCGSWDDGRYPGCEAGSTNRPSFCSDAWCYVDPCNCDLTVTPKASSFAFNVKGRKLYYSYATCGSTDRYSSADEAQASASAIGDICATPSNESVSGFGNCSCVSISNRTGSMIANVSGAPLVVPVDYGSKCVKWDDGLYPGCSGASPPDWCLQKWCYVDPCKCKLTSPPTLTAVLAGANYQGKSLFYSYEACAGTDSYTSTNNAGACVNQKDADKCTANSKCSWTGSECLGKELVSECAAAANSSSPPVKGASPTTPLSTGSYGSSACPCVAFDRTQGVLNLTYAGVDLGYPAETGGRCASWDEGRYPGCEAGSTNRPSYCSDPWCYVDPCNCDISVTPKASSFDATVKGRKLYFSYATCGAANRYSTAQEAEDSASAISSICSKPLDESSAGAGNCSCISIANRTGSMIMNVSGSPLTVPVSYGSRCKTWDDGFFPGCTGSSPPDWCTKSWCYVDPCSCKLPNPPVVSSALAAANYQGKSIYYSYDACGSSDTYTSAGNAEACVNQMSAGECMSLSKCAWTGSECLGKELVLECAIELSSGGGTLLKSGAAAARPLAALLAAAAASAVLL